MQAGQGHLGCGNPPEILLVIAVKIVPEFRQLSGSVDHLFFDHERRVALLVAAAGEGVQHKAHQGPLQPGAGAVEDIETGSGQLYAALKIQDPQRWAQVPMGLGVKVELWFLPHGLDDLVFAVIRAQRDALIRQIGEGPQQGIQPGFQVF